MAQKKVTKKIKTYINRYNKLWLKNQRIFTSCWNGTYVIYESSII